jgi:hypothetical protein
VELRQQIGSARMRDSLSCSDSFDCSVRFKCIDLTCYCDPFWGFQGPECDERGDISFFVAIVQAINLCFFSGLSIWCLKYIHLCCTKDHDHKLHLRAASPRKASQKDTSKYNARATTIFFTICACLGSIVYSIANILTALAIDRDMVFERKLKHWLGPVLGVFILLAALNVSMKWVEVAESCAKMKRHSANNLKKSKRVVQVVIVAFFSLELGCLVTRYETLAVTVTALFIAVLAASFAIGGHRLYNVLPKEAKEGNKIAKSVRMIRQTSIWVNFWVLMYEIGALLFVYKYKNDPLTNSAIAPFGLALCSHSIAWIVFWIMQYISATAAKPKNTSVRDEMVGRSRAVTTDKTTGFFMPMKIAVGKASARAASRFRAVSSSLKPPRLKRSASEGDLPQKKNCSDSTGKGEKFSAASTVWHKNGMLDKDSRAASASAGALPPVSRPHSSSEPGKLRVKYAHSVTHSVTHAAGTMGGGRGAAANAAMGGGTGGGAGRARAGTGGGGATNTGTGTGGTADATINELNASTTVVAVAEGAKRPKQAVRSII